MRCNKCNIDMEYYKPSSGGYYICVKCNRVEIPVNMGNTFHIDKQFELEKQQSMKPKQPLSLYEQILGKFYNKDSAPRTSNASRTRITSRTNSLIDNIHITQEDIEWDLHEGRD